MYEVWIRLSFNKVILVKALCSRPTNCLDISCTNLQKIITVSPAGSLLVNAIKSQKVAGCFSRERKRKLENLSNFQGCEKGYRWHIKGQSVTHCYQTSASINGVISLCFITRPGSKNQNLFKRLVFWPSFI